MDSVIEWMNDGGPIMWVIAAVSVIGWVIFAERVWVLYVSHRLDTSSFIDRVVSLVKRRRFREALDACNVKTRHPLMRVMRAGLVRADRKAAEIERGMEKEMLDGLSRVNKRIAILAVLANAATLLGLLGTIFGLIDAFNAAQIADQVSRQAELTGGISVAMYTTALGVTVALPLLFFHHFASQRAEAINTDIERGASSLLVALGGDPESAMTDAPAAASASTSQASVPA